MNDRPTPETDAFSVKFKSVCGSKAWVPTDICRRFERERDEAREKVERQKKEIVRLNGATNHAGGTPLKIALGERDKLNADLEEISSKLVVAMRERDKAREDATNYYAKIGELEQERDNLIADRDILRIDAQREAEHHDRMVGELEKAYKERDEARQAFVIATDQMVQAQCKTREALRERDEAREKENIHLDNFLFAQRDIFEMKEAIIATLEENRRLADGDDCTLAKLKSVVPEWK